MGTSKERATEDSERRVEGPDGHPAEIPTGWVLLAPGDPAATRRVKAAGDHRVMSTRKGRRRISLGVWAPPATIERVQGDLERERADPAYQRRLDAGRARRAREQAAYEEEFLAEVLVFLDFAPAHKALAAKVAAAITRHAVPVGSGTVARTQRIAVDRRAEAATIAWLRHQTTGYDQMSIARVRGRRREVRRELARHSRALLERYRKGETVSAELCVLGRALSARPSAEVTPAADTVAADTVAEG
jgi:hypothetical protein